jgi:zinc transport system substrate-binding protein
LTGLFAGIIFLIPAELIFNGDGDMKKDRQQVFSCTTDGEPAELLRNVLNRPECIRNAPVARKRLRVLILLPLVAALCGVLLTCLPAAAAPVPVFVSIAPEKWLVEQVGGDLVDVQVLVDKGREPHNFEPSPKQISRLFRSRLYFAMGLEFEQQIVDRIGRSDVNVWIVDVTVGISRIPMAGQVAGNGQSGRDPHVWLDPANLKIMAASMARILGQADFSHRAKYRQNLARLVDRLDRLDTAIREKLEPYRGSTFFVFHPAFGYFAHAYGLKQQAVEAAGKAPTPRQLSSLISRAKKEHVKVIFVQPGFDRKSSEVIAGAIDGRVVPLDPLAEDVAANLELMAEQIQAALDGR